MGLSTASVFPEPLERGFELAAELGYDGVELMVWTDPASQDPEQVRRLSHKYRVPVLSVHNPCLLITQRVWGREPWAKLRRAVAAADLLGARTVVTHPPFRWQRSYAASFVAGVADLAARSGVAVAVENMFPVHVRGRAIRTFSPGWDVVGQPYADLTLDLSHTAVSRTDALAAAVAMGPRLRHLHLADGTGLTTDEHLVPGRGTQPCGAVLDHLVTTGYAGDVVVEVSTRTAATPYARTVDLAEALAFARLHLRQEP